MVSVIKPFLMTHFFSVVMTLCSAHGAPCSLTDRVCVCVGEKWCQQQVDGLGSVASVITYQTLPTAEPQPAAAQHVAVNVMTKETATRLPVSLRLMLPMHCFNLVRPHCKFKMKWSLIYISQI